MMSIPSEAKTASKASVNLACRARIRKRNALIWSLRSISRLRGGLGGPGRCGVGGYSEEMDLSGAHFHHEQDVEGAQCAGVGGEGGGGREPGGLWAWVGW